MAKLTKEQFLAKLKLSREVIKKAGGRAAYKMQTGKFRLVSRSNFRGFCQKYGVGKPGRLYGVFEKGVKKFLNDLVDEAKGKKYYNKVMAARVKFGMADNKGAQAAIKRQANKRETIMKKASDYRAKSEAEMRKLKNM